MNAAPRVGLHEFPALQLRLKNTNSLHTIDHFLPGRHSRVVLVSATRALLSCRSLVFQPTGRIRLQILWSPPFFVHSLYENLATLTRAHFVCPARRVCVQVRLWDVAKSRELGRLSFMGHSHPVRSLVCSSNGNLLVSGGDDHKVRPRDLRRQSLPHVGYVDGRLVLFWRRLVACFGLDYTRSSMTS